MNTTLHSYMLSLLALLITLSCNTVSENTTEIDAENTRAISSEPTMEGFSQGAIVNKWQLGEDYIDLNADGSFQAVFETVEYAGKWGLSNDAEGNRTLRLIGRKVSESPKTESFNKTYELVNVSRERLIAFDDEGNKINFLTEEQ